MKIKPAGSFSQVEISRFYSDRALDRLCPTWQARMGDIKLNGYSFIPSADAELIAAFGHANLVKTFDGKLELRGGTVEDRAAAQEWISLFLHEAVPKWVGEPARTA
jgi:hypothetical protein